MISLDEFVDLPHTSSANLGSLSQTSTSMLCKQLFRDGCNHVHGQVVRSLLSSHVSFFDPEYQTSPAMSGSSVQ